MIIKWGVSTTLKYKGVSLSADLDIRQGGVMYSRTKDINYFTGNAIQTAYNDRNTMIVPNSVNEIINADGTISYVENTTLFLVLICRLVILALSGEMADSIWVVTV